MQGSVLIIVVSVCAFFGLPRQIANTVALRSIRTTDDLLKAASLDGKNGLAVTCWVIGVVIAAVVAAIVGLEPVLIPVEVLAMVPFLWVRTEQLYRLGKG